MLEYWHEECGMPLSQVPVHYLREIVAAHSLQTEDGADLDLVRRLAAIFLKEKS